MSNYGYGGGRSNPYDQRDDSPGPPYPTGGGYDAYGAPPQQQSYGRQNQYNAPAMGRGDYSGQNVELEPLAPNGQQFGSRDNSSPVLDEIRSLDGVVQSLYYSPNENDPTFSTGLLVDIQKEQKAALNDATDDPHRAKRIEELNTEAMRLNHDLVNRVRILKSRPDAGSPVNRTQIGRIDRKVKDVINMYRNVDRAYETQLREQAKGQIRIVNPNATESEMQALLDQGGPVFSQALMQGNRRGQATSALNAVRSRHDEIQKIAQQMQELSELFTQMDVLVVQQEAAVTNIEMKGEEVVENMDKGTEQIGVAIKSARNARKWKWWCLGISVLIVVIIVIIVLLYQFVFGPNAKSNRDATKNKKRFVLPSSLTTESLISSKPFDTESDTKLEVPGLDWTPNNELVRKTRRFQA